MNPEVSIAETLCLSCGMCCNGVIFADVQLQRGDKSDPLVRGGIALRLKGKKACFNQPCSALRDGACTVYSDRPKYCRDFDCALLKSVLAGETTFNAARKVVRSASQRAEKVRRILRALGETNETMPLSKRFHRVKKQIESVGCDANSAQLFGDLSMAMHSLNVLLSEAFYPGN